jgi:hypothetical protein
MFKLSKFIPLPSFKVISKLTDGWNYTCALTLHLSTTIPCHPIAFAANFNNTTGAALESFPHPVCA